MARYVNAKLQGMEIGNARPGSYATDLDSRLIHGDQAFTYESITNEPVPGNASLTCDVVHNHQITRTAGLVEESSGALIRIGHVNQYINAILNVRDGTLPSGSGAQNLFVPFYWSPSYVPPGTDALCVALICPNSEDQESISKRLLLKVYDSSINPLGNSYKFRPATISDPIRSSNNRVMIVRIPKTGTGIDFSAGGVFLFRVDAWDGDTIMNYNNADDIYQFKKNTINSIIIAPLAQKPLDVPHTYKAPTTTTNNIDTPAEYQPVESDMVLPDRSINSAALTFASRNDSLLGEAITGRPYGNKSEAKLTFSGHNHAGWPTKSAPARGGATTIDDAGEELGWNLGSWFYGTLRPFADQNPNRNFADLDCSIDGGSTFFSPRNLWGGKIVAPTLRRSISNFATISQHTFRLPAATDTNVGIVGSTTKLKATIFCWMEGAPSQTFELQVQIYDKNGLNGGGFFQTSVNTNGRHVLTIPNIKCSTNATGDGDVQRIIIQVKKSRANRRASVYGMTLYYEA